MKVVERSIKKGKGKIHTETTAKGIETKDGKQFLDRRDEGRQEAGDRERGDPRLDRLQAELRPGRRGRRPASRSTTRGTSRSTSTARRTCPTSTPSATCAGLPWLAHKASQGGHRRRRARRGQADSVYDVRAMPAAVFTHPEIATVGLQEHEAKEQGLDVKVGQVPLHGARPRACPSTRRKAS